MDVNRIDEKDTVSLDNEEYEEVLLPDGESLLYGDFAPDEDTGSFSEDTEDARPGNRFLRRLLAFITVLAFLGLVFYTSWPNNGAPFAEMVKESFRLKQGMDAKLLQSVVQISVVSRRQDAAIAVEQKKGTGFNVDPGGLIVTNYHVIENALNMTITFPDGKVYKAQRWSGKPEYDLAIISLQAAGLPAVPVDFSGWPAIGDKIRVLGNPLELKNILVEGKVEQYLRLKDNQGKIFSIDAPIYPGNSGSPVFDTEDRVVGVVFGNVRIEEEGKERFAGLAVTIDEIADLLVSVKQQDECRDSRQTSI